MRKKLFSSKSVKILCSNADLREFKSQSFKTKYFQKQFSGETLKHVPVLHEQNIFKYIRKVFLFLDPKILGLFPFLLVQG